MLLLKEGDLVSIDAIGCQTKIVSKIVEQKAEYVVAVKQNQRGLWEEINNYFNQATLIPTEAGCDGISYKNRGRGRKETHHVWTSADLEWLPQKEKWTGLKSIVCILRNWVETGKKKEEKRYYITSLESSAEEIGKKIQRHWSIENEFHWHLDVTFGEDDSHISAEANENLRIARAIALKLLKAEKTFKKGVKAKMKKCHRSEKYSGVMSGSGSLTKQNTGTIILGGTNTYSGGTTVSSGVLQGTTTSLQGTITNNSSVIFDQAATGTYSGTMSGSGTLTKTGLGKLTLSGANTFLGTTGVQQGILDVNGSLSSPVMISPSATLQGTGSVGTVQNNGTVVPGSSIGTLTITGDYTQDPTASLIIEIDDVPAISDLLLITGTANLDGSIGLNPLPGLYEAGTTYTFLQASTINGTFSQLIETHPLDFVINYFPNSVDIVVLFSGAIFPTPLEDLKGNAKKIANYLFSCSRISQG